MPFLLAVTGPYTGQAFEVRDGRMTLGRGPACDLLLAQDTAVSRAHAVLVTAGGLVQVQDAGSTHGVYVNGQRIDQALLKTGDCVQFGASMFQVQPVPAQISEPPRLRVVLPRNQFGAAAAGPAGGGVRPQENVLSPAMGCLIALVALLIPIPFGVRMGMVYLRKSDPANVRMGSFFMVASLLSLLVQVIILWRAWPLISTILNAALSTYRSLNDIQ